MDVLKNRLAVILGILNVILLLVVVNSCTQNKKYNDVKKKAELQSWEWNDKFNKASDANLILEGSMKKLAAEMEQAKADLETASKTLLQEQLVNKSLKGELDKLSKLKDALEQDLKNALVSGKSERPKK